MCVVRRGLYIGRFQPYHLGHSRVLQVIADEVGEVIIGIGSAQKSYEVRDPFTAGERVLMVSQAIEDLGIKAYVIPIEDIHRNSLWAAHVVSMVPPFDAVYSNNPLVIELFQDFGKEVVRTPLFNREEYSGTRIREMMLAGRNWKHLVPERVVGAIKSIGGVERLLRVAGSDKQHAKKL